MNAHSVVAEINFYKGSTNPVYFEVSPLPVRGEDDRTPLFDNIFYTVPQKSPSSGVHSCSWLIL